MGTLSSTDVVCTPRPLHLGSCRLCSRKALVEMHNPNFVHLYENMWKFSISKLIFYLKGFPWSSLNSTKLGLLVSVTSLQLQKRWRGEANQEAVYTGKVSV